MMTHFIREVTLALLDLRETWRWDVNFRLHLAETKLFWVRLPLFNHGSKPWLE